MSTNVTSICSSSGLWDPLIGSCKPINIANDESIQTSKNDINEHCMLELTPPLGGTIKYSQGLTMGPYPSGTIATLFCDNDNLIGNF